GPPRAGLRRSRAGRPAGRKCRRSRLRGFGARRSSALGPQYAPTGRLCKSLDDELVDVHALGPRYDEHDALRDVLRFHRLDTLVDLARGLLVAAEADEREVRVHEAGIDRADVNRAAEQILAQRVGKAAHRELGGDVKGSLLIR